jgi:hypothetical protein
MNKTFKHELGTVVMLVSNKESGIVIGRAEFAEADNSYLIRYTAGDGRLTETWWNEKAIFDKSVRG